MDLQTYLGNAIAAGRQKTLSNSDQLTLGELLLKLKPIAENQKDKKEEDIARVQFDFGTAVPTGFASWRGSYSEIALGYELSGYDNHAKHFDNVKVTDFTKMVEDAIGQTYTGWKGGEFTMNKNTPVWVANPGNSGNTGIVEVIDDGYRVILMTAYCEY